MTHDPNSTEARADDVEWSEDLAFEPKPKKKRGALFWILSGCGCGCLGLLILIGIFAYFVMQAVDDDQQWPHLRENVWFEGQQPEGLSLEFGWHWFGSERYELTDDEGYGGAFTVFESDEEMRALMSGQAEVNPVMPSELDARRITVQGREVDAVFIRNLVDPTQVPKWLGDWAELPEGQQELGFTVRVDLSGPGGRWLAFDLHVGPNSPEPTAEDVQAFLEPFDVWREP